MSAGEMNAERCRWRMSAGEVNAERCRSRRMSAGA